MLVGYARVATSDRSTAPQRDALEAAGCSRIFEETASGVMRDRPQRQSALDWMSEGDTLIVWRIDRLSRSMNHLIEIAEDLDERGIGFRSIEEGVDTTTSGGRLAFHDAGIPAVKSGRRTVRRPPSQ